MKYFIYILLILPLLPVVYCCLGSSLVRKLGDASKESGNTLKWPSFKKDSRSACDKVELVNRAEWKAQAPKSTSVISSAVDYVFIHHTAEKKCYSVNWCSQVLQGVQEYHMTHPDRMYQDIAYSFLVGEDGRIYEGRGWNRVGAHSSGYNSKSYGISFMGNYMNALPEKVALNAAKNLIACGQEKGMISANYKLYGHRDIKDTLCPGDMLYNEIRTWPDYGDELSETGDTVDENAPDQACTDESGECKMTTDPCDGSYISGKCSGPRDRQCCIESESTSADSRASCDKVELVNRAEWNAQAPKSTSAISSAVDYVFIHHTAGTQCDTVELCAEVLQGIQTYHMTDPSRMYQDIAYSFLVGEDGRIYEGRGWNREGAHSPGYNTKSYGISFMGNYTKTIPSKEALTAAKNLIACGQEKGTISASYSLYGHRDIKETVCPGDMLYNEIKTWPDYGDEFGKTGDSVDANAPDQACTDDSGECKMTTDHCDGSYIPGKCSGPSDRQCCIGSESTSADSRASCDKVELVNRAEWNAQAPKSTSVISSAVDYIFIHHTAGKQCNTVELCAKELQEIQTYHMTDPSRMYQDIAYSFLVGEDGRIYEGRGWNTVGAHSYGYNTKSYGISFMGNYMETAPSNQALTAAKNLIACGQEKGTISANYKLYGHRDIKDTLCPGDMLYNEIRTWPDYGDEFGNTGDTVDGNAPDQACTDESGECQTNTEHCDGSYISGKCSGPSDRMCCVKSESTSDTECILTDQERRNIQTQLEIDEGRREHIYNDSEGYLTFGIGHLVTDNDPEYGWPIGTPVSPERVDAAFQADLDQAVGDLDKWLSQCGDSCNNYPGEVKEILVNMLFNLGLTRLNGFVNFKKAVCAKDWNTAADEMVDSTWYGQVKDRSERLVERMRNVGGSA